jgi:hypothetical protein
VKSSYSESCVGGKDRLLSQPTKAIILERFKFAAKLRLPWIIYFVTMNSHISSTCETKP